MKIEFKVNYQKTLEAVLFLLSRRETVNLYNIMKALYAADKYHLNKYGRPVTGDVYIKKTYGVLPSVAYSFFNNDPMILSSLGLDKSPIELTDKNHHYKSTRPAETKFFSKSDIEALEHGMHSAEYTAVGIALVGLVIGVVLFAFAYSAVKGFAKTSLGAGLANICRNALGFDALYDIVFVKPYLLIAKILGRDPIDRLWLVLPALVKGGHSFTSSRQTGSLRDYASSMALGIFVLLMVLIVTQIVGK